MSMQEPAKTVYLHYTQEELDRNFDQRTWAKNALEIIPRYSARSKQTRAKLSHRCNVAYGSHPDEVLDIFPVSQSGAPVQIFIHGGAWRNFTKDDYSLVADCLVPYGVHTVLVNFSKLPAARLTDVVDQVRRAIEWVHRNAPSFGGDSDKLFVCAQSSGAHLAAVALETDWRSRGSPNDIVKGAVCVSGPYDLEPVVLSARGSYVVLTPDEILALSANRHAPEMKCPITLVYAENDTDEFRRQTRAFAAALEEAGRLTRLVLIPGLNHFELMESFGDPGSQLARIVREEMAAQVAANDRQFGSPVFNHA